MNLPFLTPENFIPSADDNGVSVQRLLALIDGSEYEDELLEVLKISEIKDDFIPIHGASTLVSKLEFIQSNFVKFDVIADLSTVDLTRSINSQDPSKHPWAFSFPYSTNEDVDFVYLDDQSLPHRESVDIHDLNCEPLYDAQSKFFHELCRFDTYANALIEAGLLELVESNIASLKEYYSSKQKTKRFRLIRHNDSGLCFYRALVSENRYKDYNIDISSVIALISMYRSMVVNKSNFIIHDFNVSSSGIEVFFENTVGRDIDGIGQVRFQVMLSNNETAKRSVRITGLFTILVMVDGVLVPLRAKRPEAATRVKDTVLSISHGQSPETAIRKMNFHNALKETEARILAEVAAIRTEKVNIGALKKIFSDRLKSTLSQLGDDATRSQINGALNQQANTFSELLEIMGKAQLVLENEGVEVKEYLKYIVYTTLVKRGSPLEGDS